MPKMLRSTYQRPYQVRFDIRGWRWPGDTHEGRTARADWAEYVSYGKGLIDPDDVPKSLMLIGSKNLKPMFRGVFWNVNETGKNLIEEIDPGRHQFLPLNITNHLDEPREDIKLYLLNVHAHQQSVIDELSDVHPAGGSEITKDRMLIGGSDKMVLDPDKLSPDVHLWRESRYMSALFMSDQLYDAFLRIKVKIPVHPVDLKSV